jgi:hypothetical protein
MNYNILGGFDNFLGGLIVGSDESDNDNKSNHSDKSDNKSNVSSYLDSQQSDNESNHSKHSPKSNHSKHSRHSPNSNHSRHSPKSNHSRHSPKSNHSEEELFVSDYTKENNSDDKPDELIEYINIDSKHENERKDNLTIDGDKKHKKNKPKNINTSPKSPHSMGSAFSSPNTPVKNSESNTPVKHSTPNSPINNSTLNSPINNSTLNTPSSDKSTVAKSPKHENKKHKNKKHKTKKHENKKHKTKKHENKSPLHSTVDSDTEPPSKSEFVDEEPSFKKLEKMIEKESNPTEPPETIKDQSDFITPEDGELSIVNLNKNANTEEPLDSDKLIFKGGSEDSPFAVLGGYINSTFST